MQKDIKDLLRLLGILFLAVLLTEFAAMFLFAYVLRGIPPSAEKVLNGFILAGAAGVVLYMFVYRDLVRETAARVKAEEDLRAAMDKERRSMAAATLASVQQDKKLAAIVMQATEQEKKLLAEAAMASAEHAKKLASVVELTKAEQQEQSTAAAEKLAAEQKKYADKVHELERKIAASEISLKDAYQHIADREEEIRMLKAGLEIKVKEGVRELLDQKVKERTRKLDEAKDALEHAVGEGARALQEEKARIDKMRQLMDEREMRLIEAKREVNRLNKELGRTEPYLGGAA